MSKAYGYVRVSTPRQAKSGLGLEAQKTEILDYARRRNLLLHGIYSDRGLSGSRPFQRRPGGRDVTRVLESGDHLILRLDRGFRSAIDAFRSIPEWVESGAYVHLVDVDVDTSTTAGQLMYRILAVFAQFERDRIRERCLGTTNERRARGEALNGRPAFGWELKGKRQVPHPVEGALVGEIWAMRWEENAKWTECAAFANRQGSTTRKGKPWNGPRLRAAIYQHSTHEQQLDLYNFWLCSLEDEEGDAE